ncbi:MAG: lipopolysaccharide assembly protein LapB [Gammaproteobacteria bacterium]|nr:MAG: lipopolysaccharide assembly protein LapB [Gammaproteobacteria bacterium]
MSELLILLLPLAAFSGWWLARNDNKNTDGHKEDDYFKGLSYLLEDETDKAIDIFFRIAHLDDSTIENQITLGNLFRHRGEIDRALHIHTHLQNKAGNNDDIQQKLNLALADDYLAAGIMNHAETHYQLVRQATQPDMREAARRKLIILYAEQSQWLQAIEIAEELDPFRHDALIQQQVAHYHCETATIALEDNNNSGAEQALKTALQCDSHCVRATIKLGRLAAKQQHYVMAINHFTQVEKQHVAFLPEILDDLADCYAALNQQHEWKDLLRHYVKCYYNPVLMLRFSHLIAETEGINAAREFLQQYLQEKPTILAVQAFVKLIDDKQNKSIHLINQSIQRVLGYTLKYRCCECGFRGNQLNWQCPGCKNWGTFTPVSDVSLKENIR